MYEGCRELNILYINEDYISIHFNIFMENQRRYFYNSNCRDVYYFVMILVLLNRYLKVYMMIATLFKHTVETYSLLLLYSFLHINLSIQKQDNRKLFKNLKKMISSLLFQLLVVMG